MLKELHKIIESQSVAQLAREFYSDDFKDSWGADELEHNIQNFLVKKGLRGFKMETTKDKIKAWIQKKAA
jgi:hypothetical protein